MPIYSDSHMHSAFSSDSKAEMQDMVESAIQKGLRSICFTEHQDHNFPVSDECPAGSFMLNVDSYLYELLCMREQYAGKISINFGIEIGLQESCIKENIITSNYNDYDFVIASIHAVDGFDTYDPKYFEHKTIKEAVEHYLDATLKNIKAFNNFDVLGHMDYINRTLPGGESAMDWNDYSDYFREILITLISKGKGIEINTCSLRDGFKNPNPHKDIVKLYHALGGEIITIGSDAHKPQNIASGFDVAEAVLREAGYSTYYTFEKRQPTQHLL